MKKIIFMATSGILVSGGKWKMSVIFVQKTHKRKTYILLTLASISTSFTRNLRNKIIE